MDDGGTSPPATSPPETKSKGTTMSETVDKDHPSPQWIAHMREISPFTGCPDGVLRPAEEHRNLGDVERSGAVLEHRWNKTAVHGCGSLVRIGFNG